MSNTDLKERLDEWRDANPLRKWRVEKEMTLMSTSAVLEVGQSTVQYWESGSRRPGDDAFERLGALMAVSAGTVVRRWNVWAETRPTP